MKRFICLLLCALVFLPVKAFAAVVSDDFATLHEKSWNKYQNLSISEDGISADYGWDNPPDNTALLMSSPQVVSTALYAVTNAQTAQFFIYSNYSTVAEVRGGEYYLGVIKNFKKYTLDANSLMRTRLNSARNGVYLEVNQGWQKAFWVEENGTKRIKFIPTLTPFSFLGKGENYGLTVLASADNKSFAELTLTISEVRNSRNDGTSVICYYEGYSCNIPENTKFIRLELRETRGFDELSVKLKEHELKGSLRFAEVNFLGNDVKWGSFPPPKPPEPPKPSEPSEPPKPSEPSEPPKPSEPSELPKPSESSNPSESSKPSNPPEPSELPKPSESSEPPVTSPLPSSSMSEDSSTSSAEETSSQSEDSSYDETTSEEETSFESDTSESDWTTSPSGDDPDLEKPTSRPNKPEKSFKIEVIEEKLPAQSKKESVKAASKVSNKSSAKASSKASSKEPAKSSKAEALPAQPSASEQKAENVATPIQPVEPEQQRDIHEEKRMAVAGTYIAGASFVLAGLIRKP